MYFYFKGNIKLVFKKENGKLIGIVELLVGIIGELIMEMGVIEFMIGINRLNFIKY